MKTNAKIKVRKGSHGFLAVNRDLRTRLEDKLLDTEGTAFLDLARGLPPEKVNDTAPADVGLTPGKLDLLDTAVRHEKPDDTNPSDPANPPAQP